MSMHVTLPDGTRLELPDGASGADVAAAIGPGLARAALAIEVDGELRDLARPVDDGGAVSILTADGDAALALIRHDAAHVLASAVTELYPGVKVSIGPAIDSGFYYDFDFPAGVSISEDDLAAIEAKMLEHVRAAEPFVREELAVEAARERFAAEQQQYKVELIDDLVRDEHVQTVSLYTNGPFTDLCRGPHAPSTAAVKAFALQSVAGAYWRGDAKRPMLTRIYGTAFFSKAALEEHLERLALARARDHRRLGRELGLFQFSELAPGSAFWMPHGTTLWNALRDLAGELTRARGYTEVKTPQLYDAQLWRISGHWEKYRDNMFVTADDEHPLGLKPMNCPGHCVLYAMTRHSYRDLPVRYAEPGLLHRNEPSGTLHGLLRARHFAQDDAHIFCTEEQVRDEVAGCLDFGLAVYRLFGFETRIELATRPEVRIGDDALWDRAEAALQGALATDRGGQRQFGARELDARRRDVNLARLDQVRHRNLTHQDVIHRQGQFLNVDALAHGEIALRVEVHRPLQVADGARVERHDVAVGVLRPRSERFGDGECFVGVHQFAFLFLCLSSMPMIFLRQKYAVARIAKAAANRGGFTRISGWWKCSAISLISPARYSPALTPLMGPVST